MADRSAPAALRPSGLDRNRGHPGAREAAGPHSGPYTDSRARGAPVGSAVRTTELRTARWPAVSAWKKQISRQGAKHAKKYKRVGPVSRSPGRGLDQNCGHGRV